MIKVGDKIIIPYDGKRLCGEVIMVAGDEVQLVIMLQHHVNHRPIRWLSFWRQAELGQIKNEVDQTWQYS